MVRIPMRDGIRLNGTLYFAKDQPRQNLPTILVFFPYQINGASPENMEFLQHGYAIAYVNARGRYYSEGRYTFLVGSGNDSYDTIDWLAAQPWSNGKVGALGCSSSAEEQHKMNAMHNPHFGAAVPWGSGAGIGKVGPYNEIGNFYRGGAFEFPWLDWYYLAGTQFKPSFPADLSREQLLRLARFWPIEPTVRDPSALDTIMLTLPLNQIPQKLGMFPTDLDDFLNRLPNDLRWQTREVGNEGDLNGAPALYVNSWYDISVGPNIAMYEYQAKNAANEIARKNTFMIVAPTLHCTQALATEHTTVGERDMGDARFDYMGFMLRWYDHWLKGVDNGIEREPHVRAYLMGTNEWRTYDTWPPRDAQPLTYYLDSDGKANTRDGNGRLSTTRPSRSSSDSYAYDPLHPTPSVGGQLCCVPGVKPGAIDQATVETRPDVLVYTTPPLTRTVEVTGPVKVTLYLSSDVKDTDLLVKLVDVYPDGRAYNLDEGVQRVRWRQGYLQPVFMQRDNVYKVEIPSLETSNAFLAGHRIRLEVASSSFPHFERNLNTGGNNYDESAPVTAHNVIHHAPMYPSSIVLSVVPTKEPNKI
jgi:putative CocE/NonD family hydrolase